MVPEEDLYGLWCVKTSKLLDEDHGDKGIDGCYS